MSTSHTLARENGPHLDSKLGGDVRRQADFVVPCSLPTRVASRSPAVRPMGLQCGGSRVADRMHAFERTYSVTEFHHLAIIYAPSRHIKGYAQT